MSMTIPWENGSKYYSNKSLAGDRIASYDENVISSQFHI